MTLWRLTGESPPLAVYEPQFCSGLGEGGT